MEKSDVINFSSLEKELQAALEADRKYQRENDAKFRALNQNVASYEEFRCVAHCVIHICSQKNLYRVVTACVCLSCNVNRFYILIGRFYVLISGT